jgi:hypothetical protein
MEIKFREWADLSNDERENSIHTARMWLRGDFPLLLACDLTDACRCHIIGEAGRLEQDRDIRINEALFA